MSVSNTTIYFIYNKNSVLSGRHVSTFIRSSSGLLGKQIQELSIFQCIVGSQMLTDFVTGMQNWCLFLLSSEETRWHFISHEISYFFVAMSLCSCRINWSMSSFLYGWVELANATHPHKKIIIIISTTVIYRV